MLSKSNITTTTNSVLTYIFIIPIFTGDLGLASFFPLQLPENVWGHRLIIDQTLFLSPNQECLSTEGNTKALTHSNCC